MKRSIAAFKLLGVSVRIDASWIFIALLFAWSLASGDFPQLYGGLPASTYWAMALFAVAGLAVSIVLHELAHTLVGRALGVPISGITLFIFGGVAEMEAEPRSARSELAMALAGPLLSLALAGLFHVLADALGGPPAKVLAYLAAVNFVLAVFNMTPAFPLDGGRVLRALLWMAMQDGVRATRLAARIGEFIGLGLVLLGGLAVVAGAVAGGLWWVLIGWYLRSLAAAERAQASGPVRPWGLTVRQLMGESAGPVPSDMSIARFVEDHLSGSSHEFFPLERDGRLAGAVTPRDLLMVDRQAWSATPLSAIALEPDRAGVIDADEDASEAFERMRRNRLGHLAVTDEGRVIGALDLRDLLGMHG